MSGERINILATDVYRQLYFICAKSQNSMYGLNGKSDFIGGIIDRWINTIGETLIFDNYLFPKYNLKYKVINDFYLYDPKIAGICPDLIGVKIETKDIPFIKFSDKWLMLDNAPKIEVKTFKTNQYLVSLRNQGYDDSFLLLLNMQLKNDYLVSFFNQTIFSDEIYKSLKMKDSIFNINTSIESVTQVSQILTDNNIGEIELLKLTKVNNFIENSELLRASICPVFIKNIIKVRPIKKPKIIIPLESLVKKSNNFYKFNKKGYQLTKSKNKHLLMWSVTNIKYINVLKINKSNLYICSDKISIINGINLEANTTYKIDLGTLERQNSKSDEYFLHKSIVYELENHEVDFTDNIRSFIDEAENNTV